MGLIYDDVVAQSGFDPLVADMSEEFQADAETYCNALVFAGNRIDPPEYCEDETEPGSEFCAKHALYGQEYEPEDGPPEGWDE